MKKITARVAVLAAGLAVPVAIATGAMAATGPGGNVAAQVNSTHQSAQSRATSFQVAPSVNLQLAVLSKDSNNGDVTQAPSSSASSAAVNPNGTHQSVSHASDPSQDPSTAAQAPSQVQAPSQAQAAAQPQDPSTVSQAPAQAQAPSTVSQAQAPTQAQDPAQVDVQANETNQKARSKATSAQFAPSVNRQVTVGSDKSGNGDVTQAPSSSADSAALNLNGTRQGIRH